MKVKLVMLYDEGRAGLGSVSEPIYRAYAIKHGYGFTCYHSLFDAHQNASWNKLTAVRSQMDDCDWIMWVDADVILLRDDIKVEDVVRTFSWDKPLLISLDKWGICFGIFLIKNCAWAKAFIDMLPFLGTITPGEPFDTHDTWEQNSIKCLMHHFADFRGHVATLPEWLLVNQNSDFWPKAWMCHYWASGKPDLEIVRQAMLGCLRDGWSPKFHKV